MIQCHRCGSKLVESEPNEYALRSDFMLLCPKCNKEGNLVEINMLGGIDNFDTIWDRFAAWNGKFRNVKYNYLPLISVSEKIET